jgi:hydroxyquinol 1,2-dioxygenase
MSGTSSQWITDEVLSRLKNAPDTRVRSISESLVRHLHAFIREIEPTTVEWEAAIGFLTAVGQMCTPERQEFILLSDTLGASMLVDALNYESTGSETESTVLGPFYLPGPPTFENGAAIDAGMPGMTLFVDGRIIDEFGDPLPGVTIDTWQSDSDGFYDVQRSEASRYLRGRFTSDSAGLFSFWSILPSSYPIPDDGPVGAMLKAQGRHPYRPAHVHFRFFGDRVKPLVTHIFVAGDQYLDSDAVFGVKDSLVERFDLHDPSEAPADHPVASEFAKLQRTFVLKRADR